MFDANMRHLPKGFKFFADVWGLGEDTLLYMAGVRKGDVVFCEMLEDQNDNPAVKFFVGEDKYVVTIGSEESLFSNHLIYLGHLNQWNEYKDFIYDLDEKRAREVTIYDPEILHQQVQTKNTSSC